MGRLTDVLTKRLEPKMAIIVYEDSEEESFYLENRPITAGQMGAAIPLSEECMISLVDNLTTNRKDIIHGRVPATMLFTDSRPGHEKYVWYHGPEKKTLFFKDSLDMQSGTMWVPGLIYVADGRNLSLYAFKGKKPKKDLYRAPFFNVDEKVCLGNAKAKKPVDITYDNIIKYWETLFWNSEFTHILGGNPVKGNLSTLIKRCIETGCRFPEDELITSKKKLEDLI